MIVALNNTLLQSLKSQTATPMVLLQLNIPQELTTYVVDSAGIWKFSVLTNVYAGIDPEITENFNTLDIVGIGSVTVDGVSLGEVTSYTNTIDGRATALSTEPGYIYDGVNDVLYCRFDDDYSPPLIKSITIGGILGLSDFNYYDYVNNINYVTALQGTPSIAQRKDPIFFGSLRFDSFTQVIDNAAYEFDQYRTAGVFGSLARYYLGTNEIEFEYFEEIYEGRVVKSSFSTADLTWILSIRDARKTLSNPIPINYISDAAYPNADDYASSTPAPLLYGNVVDSPCISLKENATSPSNYVFLFADASEFDLDVSSTTIKVDGLTVTPSTAPVSTTGLFELSSSDYTPGQTVTYSGGGFKDGTGTIITNQIDVAQHLLENYADIPYTANNFNTTEWEAARAVAKNIGISVNRVTDIKKTITLLAATSADGFLQQPDGLYTWRIFNPNGEALATIRNEDWIDHPKLDNDSNEVLSSATVNYNQSYSLGKWQTQTDDSKAVQVKQVYNIVKDKEFNTLYTSDSDALSFAQEIMDKSDAVRDIITGTVGLEFMEAEIGQNIQIECNHADGTEWLGKLKCEVLETAPDVSNGRLRLVLRAFEEIDDFTIVFDFNGDETSTIYDFNNETASIIDFNGE